MIPFAVKESSGITLHDFKVDLEETLALDMVVTEVEAGSFDVSVVNEGKGTKVDSRMTIGM